jgi:RimJ/RimL family protein N-acetyltransferase
VPVLRDVADADLAIFFEHQSDPEAAAMAAFPSRDRDTFMAHWATMRANDATRQWTIVDDGVVAGNIGCWHDGERRLVGYWIGREFWGRGLATRALGELLEIVEERPLHAYVVKHNAASIRVLQKCGFAEVEEHTGEGGVVELLFRIGPERE